MTYSKSALAGSALLLTAGILLLAACGGSYEGGGGGPAQVTFAVNPTTITLGQSATLTWNTNGNNCTASGDWTGSKAASGTEQVTPTEARSHAYQLQCRGGRYGESPTMTATLAVNPVATAALWLAEACCDGAGTITIVGVTDISGDSRFLMGKRHYVGRAGDEPVAYATCDDSLAGARLAKAPAPTLLRVERLIATRAATLAGNFTTHLATGYTLTLTVDSAGEVIGSDTRGCRVNGRVAEPGQAAASAAAVVLDVSACGTSDGRYAGNMALVADASGHTFGLLVLASNAKSAIGWRLER